MSPFMSRVRRRLLEAMGGLMVLMATAAHAGSVTYVYTDPQGTPLAEADASGNITATYDYAPYGSQALGSPPNGPGYTGHVNDPDTGLVYMQARYYDPSVGRFLSVDPVAPAVGNPFNFNRFAYANNSPIDNMDPDGRLTGTHIMDEDGNSPMSGNTVAGPGSGGVHQLSVKDVFNHSSVDKSGRATPSDFPKATKSALGKILHSPQGRMVGEAVVRSHNKINLLLLMAPLEPEFRWSDENNGIKYSMDVTGFIKSNDKHGELVGATLDVLLMHEIGHTPQASSVFAYRYSATFSYSNEYDVVRNVENPYRAFIGGIDKRETYNGYAVPAVQPLE